MLRAATVIAVIAFFSCSRSPLDPSTELGDRVITDYDRDALDFGENFSIVIDSLAVDSVFSFTYDISAILDRRLAELEKDDERDSADIAENLYTEIYSGLHRPGDTDSVTAGERGDEYAVAYLEFDLNTIRNNIEDHKKLDYCLDTLTEAVVRIPVNPASIREKGEEGTTSGSAVDPDGIHLLFGEPKSRGELIDTAGWVELPLRYREGQAELEATMDSAWIRSLDDSLKSFLDSAYGKAHLKRAFAITVDSGLVRLPLKAGAGPRLVLRFNSDTSAISDEDARKGGCEDDTTYSDSFSYSYADYSGLTAGGGTAGVDGEPTSAWVSRRFAVFQIDLEPFYEIADRGDVRFALSAHVRIGVKRGMIDYERDSLPFVYSFQDSLDLLEPPAKAEFHAGVFVPRKRSQFEIPVTDYINDALERGYRGPVFLLIALLSEEQTWGDIGWEKPERMKFEALVVPSTGGGL